MWNGCDLSLKSSRCWCFFLTSYVLFLMVCFSKFMASISFTSPSFLMCFYWNLFLLESIELMMINYNNIHNNLQIIQIITNLCCSDILDINKSIFATELMRKGLKSGIQLTYVGSPRLLIIYLYSKLFMGCFIVTLVVLAMQILLRM